MNDTDWIVRHVMRPGTVTLLTGPNFIGKSVAALQLAVDIASESDSPRTWLGMDITNSPRSVLWTEYAHLRVTTYRLSTFHRNMGPAAADRLHFTEHKPLTSDVAPALEFARRNRLDVLVLDKCAVGLNDAEWREWIDGLRACATGAPSGHQLSILVIDADPEFESAWFDTVVRLERVSERSTGVRVHVDTSHGPKPPTRTFEIDRNTLRFRVCANSESS